MDEWVCNLDGWMDECMDEWMNGYVIWMDGWMDHCQCPIFS